MKTGTVYKKEWQVSDNVYKQLHEDWSEEQYRAYFESIKNAWRTNTCQHCGKEIKIDYYWTDEHINEYRISGLCKDCQVKIFKRGEEYETKF